MYFDDETLHIMCHTAGLLGQFPIYTLEILSEASSDTHVATSHHPETTSLVLTMVILGFVLCFETVVHVYSQVSESGTVFLRE